jgi:hypothetical protein
MVKHFYQLNIRKIHPIIVILLLLSISCDREEDQYVPNVPDFSIELDMTNDLASVGVGQLITITPNKTQPDYSDLNYFSTNIKIKKIPYQCYGNGIVLVKGFDGEFKAYDLTCPVNAFTDYCSVTVKSSSIDQNAVCPCCKSEFILHNSCVPTSTSEAKRSLRQYNVSIISFNSRMLIGK